MAHLVALIIVLLSLVFMAPWARLLLRRDDEPLSRLAWAVTTLALSIGTLTLVMMWIGFVSPIQPTAVIVGCAVIGAAGVVVNLRFTSPPGPLSASREGERINEVSGYSQWMWFAAIVLVIIAVLVVFNAVYWPLGTDDATVIYGSFGKQIFQTHQLPRGVLYELYPMLVPLAYAFTHMVSGGLNEHLATLYPALLSVGVIGVAYLLGTRLYNRRIGIVAALIVALTPMFGHWASAGYIDLPVGFFYGLAVYFLWRADRWQDALLGGIMAGLCAWTKNSGLIVIASIALWWLYCWWRKRAISVRNTALIIAGVVLTAGPWYLRNVITAGMIVPPTGWTWKAAHDFSALFPYITDPRYFVIGWLLTLALLATLVIVWLERRYLSNQRAFLLIFYVPFFAVWWALFSYDGRFLLILAPVIAVIAANIVSGVVAFLSRGTPRPLERLVVLAVIIVLAIPTAIAAVDFKPELLRHPLMAESDKLSLRLGADRYATALYLRTLPAGSHLWLQDLMLPYYVDGLVITIGNTPQEGQLASYDYWLASPDDPVPSGLAADKPIFTQGGYRLYQLKQQ